MKSIFYHKDDSQYKDQKGQRYHFPKTYLSRVENTLRDWIIYYGPIKDNPSRYYSGTAFVKEIIEDPETPNHYFAELESYLDFDRLVSYQENGGYEKKLFQLDGSVNGGRAVQSVRNIENAEFESIIEAGLSLDDEWPDRIETNDDAVGRLSFSEQQQEQFEIDRPTIETLTNRKWRDSKFRQNVRVAYDRRCAFTGLRLINGKGRPEIEAAHIRPVHKDGSDSIRNGIALSGTVHWMFDRGMLSLTDEFEILCSRHMNSDISHILNKDMKAIVPSTERLRPHPTNLAWHRENIFKQ